MKSGSDLLGAQRYNLVWKHQAVERFLAEKVCAPLMGNTWSTGNLRKTPAIHSSIPCVGRRTGVRGQSFILLEIATAGGGNKAEEKNNSDLEHELNQISPPTS